MAPPKRVKTTSLPTKSKSKISTLTLDSLPVGPKDGSSVIPTSSRMPLPSSEIQAPGNSKLLIPMAKPNLFSDNEKSLPPRTQSPLSHDDEDLWVDRYAPEIEADLAVHKKKVQDVRRWLTEAFGGGFSRDTSKYRRIIALTGPAGSGKTAVLRVLARELDFEIVEWSNAMDDNFNMDGQYHDRESLTMKLQTFLSRASSCGALPSSSSTASFSSNASRRIVLFEDLPNILHPTIAEAFHDALEVFLDSPPDFPLVIVVSDAGIRGEDPEGDSFGLRGWEKKSIDVRSIVPHKIFKSPYFTEIQFNPVSQGLLVKALSRLLARHSASTSSKSKGSIPPPGKDVVQMVVNSARGDIRNAAMTLQFICSIRIPKGKKANSARILLEAVTRREQSLMLFHMLGKVLYNKRKDDPKNPTTTSKDGERETELDAKISDPPDLPPHLAENMRRPSRVDANRLHADSPIDASLFALYLHHNYTQFCNEVDECGAVCDWFSWVDASCGDMWLTQQNIPQFHMLTLGTLHGLPSPVTRRGQNLYKPDYFNVLKKTRAAEDAVMDTQAWLNIAIETESAGARRWALEEIVLEMGVVLKAMSCSGVYTPPATHHLFTDLSFLHPALDHNNRRVRQLGEAENPDGSVYDTFHAGKSWARNILPECQTGGWLEDDDIQSF